MSDHCPVCDALLFANEPHCRACAAPITPKLSSLPPRMRWLVWTRRLVLVNCVVCMVPAFMMAVPAGAVVVYGLTHSRCPECGTSFDPARVA